MNENTQASPHLGAPQLRGHLAGGHQSQDVAAPAGNVQDGRGQILRLRRKQLQAILLVAFLNLAFTTFLQAAAGDLDPSFAGTGRTRFGFGFGEDFAAGVVVQPDGKVIVAGSSGENSSYGGKFSMVRYGTNDTLDLSFGDGGKVITPIPGTYLGQYAEAKAVQVQVDGKILLAGWVYDGTNNLFALVRYNPDGSLDHSFGTEGIATTEIGQSASANAMVIQPDGRILLAGSSSDGSGTSGDIALARYTTSGALDASFGSSGKVVSNFRRAQANGVALQASGKILVAAAVSNTFALVRYTASGALDTTFGGSPGNGLAMLRWSGSSSAAAVAVQPGDAQTPEKIVVVGNTEGNTRTSHYDLVTARYDLNGFTDFLYGSFGAAITSIGTPDEPFGDFPTSILIQGAGSQARIIVAGVSGSIFTRDSFFVARLQGGGSLDPSFDGDGKAFAQFSANDDDRASAMAFVPGGRLLVVGSTVTNPGNTDFALVRYNLSDGSLDASFGQDGRKTQDVAERSASPGGMAIQADGKIVLAGSCYTGENYAFALARLNPNGVLDPTFGSGGRVVVLFGGARSEARAVVIQADGKIVAAGSSADDFALVRLNPNGAFDPSFDGDGIVTTSFGTNRDLANAVALQADGRIVVAGSSDNGVNNDFAVVRYRTNGTLDASFNLTGKVTTAFGTNDESAGAVKIQSDGKIVVAGYAVVGGRGDFATVRYNTNGTRDASFGTSGRVTTAIESQAVGLGLALQPDGKIVLAGYALLADVDGQIASIDLGVVRYGTNGAPDNTFGSGGVVTTTSGRGQLGATVVLQPDGKILVGGIRINSDTDGFESAVARFLDTGVLDPSYGNEGTAVLDSGDEAFSFGALALDSLGQAVMAGSDGEIFGVARLQADPNLRILTIARPLNRHTVLTGIGAPGTRHTLESSTGLTGGFTVLGTVTTDSAGRWQYDDTASSTVPRRFYRLAFP